MTASEIEKNLTVIPGSRENSGGLHAWHSHSPVMLNVDGKPTKIGYLQVTSLNGTPTASTHYTPADGQEKAVLGRDLAWLAREYREDNGGRAARLAAIAAKGKFEIAQTFGLPGTTRAGHKVLIGGTTLEVTKVDDNIVAFKLKENGRVISDALARDKFSSLVEMNLLAVAA